MLVNMGYRHRRQLRPLLCNRIGLFLLFQQMLHLASEIAPMPLVIGKTITHVTSKDFSNIYVGGVNFIAQLSENLEVTLNLTIGPVKEAEHCAPNPAPCDNHVRVMEVDRAHDLLIVCGSAYNGTCTLHNLSAINDWYCLFGESGSDNAATVSGSLNQTTVFVFLPPTRATSTFQNADVPSNNPINCRSTDFATNYSGPIDPSRNHVKTQASTYGLSNDTRPTQHFQSKFSKRSTKQKPGNVFNEGEITETNTDSQNVPYAFQSNLLIAGNMYNPELPTNPPIVSLRNVIFHKVGRAYTIGYARDQNSQPVGLNFNKTTPTMMLPDYKFAFTWENYSYLLFLQEKDCKDSNPCIVSKISRSCHNTSSIMRYLELPLSCETKSKKFQLLSAAALGTVGLQLGSGYVTVPVLLMAFGAGSTKTAKTPDPSQGTAICAISLDDLNKREFDYALKVCDEGQDLQIVKHVSWIVGAQSLQCQNETDQNDTCSTFTRNKYVETVGNCEITTKVKIDDVSIVSILTHTHILSTSNGRKFLDRMDVFLLDNKGYFRKLSARAKQSNGILQANLDSTISDLFQLHIGASTQPVGITDQSNGALYVASDQTITKVHILVCPKYLTCAECRDSGENCRWCPIEKSCRDKDHVLNLPSCQGATETTCPPILYDFRPVEVPTDGGTMLTLFGAHLGRQDTDNVNVTVCDQQCDNIIANDNNLTCKVPEKCSSCNSICVISVFVSGQTGSNGNTSSVGMNDPRKLRYVDPNVTTFTPKYGAAFGGTVLTFQGQNIMSGSFINITVGDARCNVIRSSHNLSCRIARDENRKTQLGEIRVAIDNFKTRLSDETFHFRSNPEIYSMNPMHTIASGGVTITIKGSNLKSVSSHQLELTMPYSSPESNSNFTLRSSRLCTVIDNGGSTMTCKTPDIGDLFSGSKNNIMVNVTINLDESSLNHQSEMSVQGDPIIPTTNEAFIPRSSKHYTITGMRIPNWIGRSDIIVTIGTATLDVIDMTSSQIVCNVTKAIAMYKIDSQNTTNTSSTEDQDVDKTNNSVKNTTRRTNVSDVTVPPSANATTLKQPLLTSTKDPRAPTTKDPRKPTTKHPGTSTTKDPRKPTTKRPGTSSTKDPGKLSKLQIPFSSLKNMNNSDNEINRNSSTTWEAAESLNSTNDNVTYNSTTATPGSVFPTTETNTRNIIKYKIMIQIGNFMKNDGFVTIGPDPIKISTNESIATVDLSNFNLTLIAGAVGTFVIFLILVTISCVMYVRARKARALVKVAPFYMGSMSSSQHGSREGAIPTLKQILQAVIEPDKRSDMDQLIISLNRLTVGKSIGSGNFGCVFEATLSSKNKEIPTEKVAVKTLQDPSSYNIDFQAFVQEAVIMKEFQHPHVLGLIGLAEKEPGIPYVILPYMDNGDLLTYVRDGTVILNLHDVIKFGADIASGMAYLSALKFVHRDLAARNCMLDDLYRVKVADFGLCRDIYEKGYYQSDNKKKLPIRWMAVESIDHGAYSSKSDVWSLGVVLWELLSRGVTPYPGVNGWDIINFLRHRRLAPPHFCPDELYGLMMKCWAKDPELRPDFITIQTQLLGIIGQCPTVADTMKRKRGDTLHTYDKDTNTSAEGTKIKSAGKSSPTGSTVEDKKNCPKVLEEVNKKDKPNLDSIDKKGATYVNLNIPQKTHINNIFITIPACYSHRDVSKTAAGTYIQLVDSYEPPPKFSNPLLRSLKKHSKKSHNLNTKGLKKSDEPKVGSSGYSFPGEFLGTPSSIGDRTSDIDGKSRTSDVSVANRSSKDRNYYDLETTSLRSSATSDNRSGWSVLNTTGSSACILENESRVSATSNGVASTNSSLTVPQSLNMSRSSTHGVATNKISTSPVPERSPDRK